MVGHRGRIASPILNVFFAISGCRNLDQFARASQLRSDIAGDSTRISIDFAARIAPFIGWFPLRSAASNPRYCARGGPHTARSPDFARNGFQRIGRLPRKNRALGKKANKFRDLAALRGCTETRNRVACQRRSGKKDHNRSVKPTTGARIYADHRGQNG